MKNTKLSTLIFVACNLILVAAQADPVPAADAAAGREYALARLSRADLTTATTLDWAAGMENQLARLSNSPPVDAVRSALAAAQAAHAAKLAEVRELERKLEELKNAAKQEKIHDEEIENEIADLRSKLDEAKKELAALALVEADLMLKLQHTDGGGVGLTTSVAAGGRTSITVAIRGNLVAPVARPYFVGQRVSWTDGDSGIEISAAQDGVPLGTALADGGWLAQALAQGSPDQNFIGILVTSDSIPTYYALLKELRQRGYLHIWDTWDGKPFHIITTYAPGHAAPDRPTQLSN